MILLKLCLCFFCLIFCGFFGCFVVIFSLKACCRLFWYHTEWSQSNNFSSLFILFLWLSHEIFSWLYSRNFLDLVLSNYPRPHWLQKKIHRGFSERNNDWWVFSIYIASFYFIFVVESRDIFLIVFSKFLRFSSI